MYFEGSIVPGAEWVEIVQIRNKDSSHLAENNWRRKLIGQITLCWVAGGFKRRGLYFKGDIRIVDGNPIVVDLGTSRWCSTTTAFLIEVAKGVYDLESNTSIYQLRILTKEEKLRVLGIINRFRQQRN